MFGEIIIKVDLIIRVGMNIHSENMFILTYDFKFDKNIFRVHRIPKCSHVFYVV